MKATKKKGERKHVLVIVVGSCGGVEGKNNHQRGGREGHVSHNNSKKGEDSSTSTITSSSSGRGDTETAWRNWRAMTTGTGKGAAYPKLSGERVQPSAEIAAHVLRDGIALDSLEKLGQHHLALLQQRKPGRGLWPDGRRRRRRQLRSVLPATRKDVLHG